jgi:hypothetical protein
MIRPCRLFPAKFAESLGTEKAFAPMQRLLDILTIYPPTANEISAAIVDQV